MSASVIRLQSVSKKFRYWADRPTSIKTILVDALRGKLPRASSHQTLEALQDISFEIGSGEFIGIIGRNGAGKSTLLKLICGIYQPNQGSVEIQGQVAPLIELGAGFAPDLSGYENIFLNASILGYGKRAAQEALPHILEFAELGDLIHMPIRNYSSGMLVRLGFSIATHLPAPIILVDEVLAVGDASFQVKCLEKIHDLHRKGRTIVLVTHDLKALQENCSRCIVIEEKKKVFDGAPAAGVEKYLQSVRQPGAAGTS